LTAKTLIRLSTVTFTSAIVALGAGVHFGSDAPGLGKRHVRSEIAERKAELRRMLDPDLQLAMTSFFGEQPCFAPGTPDWYVRQFIELGNPPLAGPHHNLTEGNTWPGPAGEPIELTWSLAPDGIIIPGRFGAEDQPNSLFATLDAQFFGDRQLWIEQFERSFARWAELGGTNYTRITFNGEDWDDGADWGEEPASATHGDVRIGMYQIDFSGSILAFNRFPTMGGDMVMDNQENWRQGGNSFRFMRNIVMHEHGHGLGFPHICPINQGRLMEPFLDTTFDGPQHDDIRGIQRGYGDTFEPNDAAGEASDLGLIAFGPTMSFGDIPNAQPIQPSSTLSIDKATDEDWFQFSVDVEAQAIVTVTPLGFSYDSSIQNDEICAGTGSCCSGNIINSLAQANLNFEIVDADGMTVLATADIQPAGIAESTSAVLPVFPEDYLIRVYPEGAVFDTQLYRLNIRIIDVTADTLVPEPDPIGFAVAPTPVSPFEITMQAVVATDATPPVEYEFQHIGTSVGGSNRTWNTSPVYNNTGLSPNLPYSYKVRARDAAPPPGPNVGEFSQTLATVSMIQTPTGVAFDDDCAAVAGPCQTTATSIEMETTGTLSWLSVGQSGALFDNPAGSNDGINEWVQGAFFGQPGRDVATGLDPDTLYEFRAKARNRVAFETEYGTSGFKATLAAVPGAPLLSAPLDASMLLVVDGGGNPGHTVFAVQCTDSTDANWNGQYADAFGMPNATPVWQTASQWLGTQLSDMLPQTAYTFAAKARNQETIETAFGPTSTLSTCAPEACFLPCDLNQSGLVNGEDFSMFLDSFGLSEGDPGFDPAADLDGSGSVNFVDYQQWLVCFAAANGGEVQGGPPVPEDVGDLNNDGLIDGRDIQPFVKILLDPSSASFRDRFIANVNLDGQVDGDDVPAFLERLLQPSATSSPAAPATPFGPVPAING